MSTRERIQVAIENNNIDFIIQYAVIARRMVTVNHFSSSMALVCAGATIQEAEFETNINRVCSVYLHYLRTHGGPCHSNEPSIKMLRYRYFTQFCQRGPTVTEEDVTKGLNHFCLKLESFSNGRASAIRLISGTNKDTTNTNGSGFCMKCQRLDAKNFHNKQIGLLFYKFTLDPFR